MSQGRDYKLDRLRIISMILVITVHAANWYCRAISSVSPFFFTAAAVFNVFSRISVPLFFMISGAVLLSREYDGAKNRKRILYKLMSLVFITTVFYFWDRYFKGVENISIIKLLAAPERVLLWFLYALLGIYIVLPFIKRMTDGMNEREDRLFLILFAVFGGLIYTLNIKPKYPVPIVGATFWLGYFVCGHIIYKNMEKLSKKRLRKFQIPTILVCVAAASAVASAVCLKKGSYDSSLLSYRNIFIMTAALAAFPLFYGMLSGKRTKAAEVLSSVSFGVYLFHGIFLDLFMKYFPYRTVNPILGIPVSVAAAFAVSAVFVYILRKIPGIKALL